MIRKCISCGFEFETNKAQKYCSIECALMAHVNIRADDDACWEWTGPIGSHGYGAFALQGVQLTSHRASYMVHHGPITDLGGGHGGVVMHSFDNRKCCNPKHLSLGTQGDNLRDAWSKKRMTSGHAKGEKARTAILTVEKVLQIRARLESGELGGNLAKEFSVTSSAISRIRRRKTWKHI